MINRMMGAAMALAVVVAGCSSDALSGAEPGVPPTAQDLASMVDDVQVRALGDVAGDLGAGFEVNLSLAIQPGIEYPTALRILAHSAAEEPSVLYDDGLHNDGLAGDGNYGGWASRACAPTVTETGSKDTDCTVKFVGPGEECGGWGVCPYQASRSFLWGLIEYDTSIIVCFCLDECKIGA